MSGKVKAKIELPDLTSAINSATVEVMGLFRNLGDDRHRNLERV